MTDNSSVQDSVTPVEVPAGTQGAVPPLHRYREAFDKALPASQAIDLRDLVTINIDLKSVIPTTVGRLQGILALREKAKALPEFDITAFDQLETYTLATGHAHTTYMGASAAPEAILELNERGMALRNVLYADAVALATRGLISGDRIGELKANIGYNNLAFDLMALAGILRSNWDKIASKTAITADDLDQAESIGDQLVTAVGTREATPASLADIAVQRQRNFTLFLNAYDEVRRAVSFLRWKEDDLESIAPSLYAGRGNGNAKKKADDTQPATGQPVPATAGSQLGSTPATTPNNGATAPTAAAHAAPPATSGLPGANPFATVS